MPEIEIPIEVRVTLTAADQWLCKQFMNYMIISEQQHGILKEQVTILKELIDSQKIKIESLEAKISTLQPREVFYK